MNIVLIGIQGSGKGELVKRLNSTQKYSLISVGALFRLEMIKQTAFGKKVEPIIARGELPSLDLTMRVVKKALKRAKGDIVFDGFPRTNEQADALEKICKVDLAIYLKLDKKIAKQRLLNRLTCKDCQNITSKLETKTKVCPVCGGRLEVRKDDNLKSINKRFEIFENDTYPLVERYMRAGKLVEIDASKTIEEVYNKVSEVIT